MLDKFYELVDAGRAIEAELIAKQEQERMAKLEAQAAENARALAVVLKAVGIDAPLVGHTFDIEGCVLAYERVNNLEGQLNARADVPGYDDHVKRLLAAGVDEDDLWEYLVKHQVASRRVRPDMLQYEPQAVALSIAEAIAEAQQRAIARADVNEQNVKRVEAVKQESDLCEVVTLTQALNGNTKRADAELAEWLDKGYGIVHITYHGEGNQTKRYIILQKQ